MKGTELFIVDPIIVFAADFKVLENVQSKEDRKITKQRVL